MRCCRARAGSINQTRMGLLAGSGTNCCSNSDPSLVGVRHEDRRGHQIWLVSADLDKFAECCAEKLLWLSTYSISFQQLTVHRSHLRMTKRLGRRKRRNFFTNYLEKTNPKCHEVRAKSRVPATVCICDIQ